MGTTEDTDLGPVNWNELVWEPGGAGSPTNPGRQAPPAGLPVGPRPPRSLRLQRPSRALQVTQLHSHSDATTLVAITEHWSSFQNRYDSDLRARIRAITAVPSLTGAESRLPRLSFPQEGVGCLATTELATAGTVGLDLLGTKEDWGKKDSLSETSSEGRTSVAAGGKGCGQVLMQSGRGKLKFKR